MFGQLLATAAALVPLATVTCHSLPDRFYVKLINMQKQMSLHLPFQLNFKSERKEYILVETVTELLSIKT